MKVIKLLKRINKQKELDISSYKSEHIKEKKDKLRFDKMLQKSISMGLVSGMKVEDLLDVDLTYAPPFSTSIDILISAARILKSKLN